MLLNLFPTPIHKSAITNSLSKVCAGRCVDIQSAVRANRGGAPAPSCSSNSWFNLTSTTHWETLRTLCRFRKMSGLEDLGPLPEGWTLKWHGVGNTRRPWVEKYSFLWKWQSLFLKVFHQSSHPTNHMGWSSNTKVEKLTKIYPLL